MAVVSPSRSRVMAVEKLNLVLRNRVLKYKYIYIYTYIHECGTPRHTSRVRSVENKLNPYHSLYQSLRLNNMFRCTVQYNDVNALWWHVCFRMISSGEILCKRKSKHNTRRKYRHRRSTIRVEIRRGQLLKYITSDPRLGTGQGERGGAKTVSSSL